MKSLKIFILFASISAVYCGGSSQCEPLVSKFQTFQQAWLNLIDQFLELIEYVSKEDPAAIMALIEGLDCRIIAAHEFAEKVIIRFTGASSKEIDSLFNLTSAPIFGSPLDCISRDIVYMQQHTLSIIDEFVPNLLQNAVQNETSPSDCDEVRAILEPNIPTGIAISRQLGEILRFNRQVFESIGVEDLYLANLESLAPCLLKVIGTGIGSLLNADGSVATQYLNGEITELPYPLNCAFVQNGLDFIKSHYYQDFSNLYYGVITEFAMNVPN